MLHSSPNGRSQPPFAPCANEARWLTFTAPVCVDPCGLICYDIQAGRDAYSTSKRRRAIMNNLSDRVVIIGMGCTKFGEHCDKSEEDLIVEAAYEAFEDAGIEPNQIEA